MVQSGETGITGAPRSVPHVCGGAALPDLGAYEHNKRGHASRRTVSAETLTFATANAGPDKIAFDGRISNSQKLKPGHACESRRHPEAPSPPKERSRQRTRSVRQTRALSSAVFG